MVFVCTQGVDLLDVSFVREGLGSTEKGKVVALVCSHT